MDLKKSLPIFLALLINTQAKPVEKSAGNLDPIKYSGEILKASPSERSINSLQYGIGSDPQYGISGYYPNAGFGAGNLDYGSGYDQYNSYPAGYNDYRERSYGKIPLSGLGYAAYPLNGNGGYGGYGGNGGLTSYSGYDGYYNGYDDTLPGNLGYGYFKQKNYPITYRKDYNSDPYYVYSQYPSSIGTGYVTGYRGYSK